MQIKIIGCTYIISKISNFDIKSTDNNVVFALGLNYNMPRDFINDQNV